MGLFGKEASGDSQLRAIMEALGEDILQRSLVQYHPSGSKHRPMWGLLALTPGSLHVVYGQSENWASRMIQSSSPEQQIMTIPRESITSVELPPAPTGIRRLFSGQTRVATVHTADGGSVRLEIDSDGEALLRSVVDS